MWMDVCGVTVGMGEGLHGAGGGDHQGRTKANLSLSASTVQGLTFGNPLLASGFSLTDTARQAAEGKLKT